MEDLVPEAEFLWTKYLENSRIYRWQEEEKDSMKDEALAILFVTFATLLYRPHSSETYCYGCDLNELMVVENIVSGRKDIIGKTKFGVDAEVRILPFQ